MQKSHRVVKNVAIHRQFTMPNVATASLDDPIPDLKVRLLLSNLSHDNCFLYKARGSKYYPSPKEKRHNLSLQLQHNIFRQEFSPENGKRRISNDDRTEASYTPHIEKLRRDSASFSESSNTPQPNRKKASILPLENIPMIKKSNKNTKTSNLRALIRRKSCCCSDCGGISQLEKKTSHIRPDLRKNWIKNELNLSPAQVSAGRSPPSSINSQSKDKDKKNSEPKKRRGSGSGSINLKQAEVSKFFPGQLTDSEIKSLLKIQKDSESSSLPKKSEKIENTKAKKPEQIFDQDSKQAQKQEKINPSQELSSVNLENLRRLDDTLKPQIKETKKIQQRSMTPNKLNGVSRLRGKKNSIHDDIKEVLLAEDTCQIGSFTERRNSSMIKQSALANEFTKDQRISNLKSLLARHNQESNVLETLQSEKQFNFSPEKELIEKMNKRNIKPMEEFKKRSVSLPRFLNCSYGAVQKEPSNFIESSRNREIRTVEGKRYKDLHGADKVRVQSGRLYRGDVPPTRQIIMPYTFTKVSSENISASVIDTLEKELPMQKNHKNKRRRIYSNKNLTKLIYIPLAITTYKEAFSFVKQKAQQNERVKTEMNY